MQSLDDYLLISLNPASCKNYILSSSHSEVRAYTYGVLIVYLDYIPGMSLYNEHLFWRFRKSKCLSISRHACSPSMMGMHMSRIMALKWSGGLFLTACTASRPFTTLSIKSKWGLSAPEQPLSKNGLSFASRHLLSPLTTCCYLLALPLSESSKKFSKLQCFYVDFFLRIEI